MKLRVAVFLDADLKLERVCGYDASEFSANTVRISEFVEVEFPELPRDEVIQSQADALDRQAGEHRAAILRIEQLKAELLALPAPVGH